MSEPAPGRAVTLAAYPLLTLTPQIGESGEGREWLMFGRRAKPPRIACATTEFGGTRRLAVFVGAYESLDGRRALVFANGTDANQRVAWRRGGCDHALDLASYEARLLPQP